MATTRPTPGCTRRVLRRRVLPILVAAAAASLAVPTSAATFHWQGGIAPFPTLWSNSFNWTPIGAPTGLSFVDVLEFGGSFGNSLNNIRDNFILNGIRAFAGAPAGATGTVGGQSLQFSGPSAFIEVGTGGTLTVASSLVGGTDWNKQGAGVLRLTGDNLGYTGTINLVTGELSASGPLALGTSTKVATSAGTVLRLANELTFARLSGAGQVQIDAQANIGLDGTDSTFSGRFTGSGALGKVGGGRMTLSGVSDQYLGAVTVASGALDLTAANAFSKASGVDVATNATLRIGAAQSLARITGAGTVQLDASLLLGKPGNDFTFAGAFGGSGTLTTQGGHITYTGRSPSFSGSIIVDTGVLEFALGAHAGDLPAMTVHAAGELIAGDPDTTFGSLAGAGRLTVARNAFTFGTDGTDTTFSGTVSGPGKLAKTGGGIFSFTGTKTEGGDLEVRGGVFRVAGGTGSSANILLTGGRLELQGADSSWTATDTVRISSEHAAPTTFGITVLRLTDGASLTSSHGTITDSFLSTAHSESDSMVVVRGRSAAPGGSASTWTVHNSLTIGQSRFGSLSVESGGHLATGSTLIASGLNSHGRAVVDGAGGPSSWTNDGTFSVGQYGSGSLVVRNGGRIDTGAMSFGEATTQTGPFSHSTGSGNLVVNGRSADGLTASTVAVTDELRVGNVGNGRISVENLGFLSAGSAVLGASIGGSGEVWVLGQATPSPGVTQATITVAGSLEVGRSGSGVVRVLDGGHLISGSAVIGGTSRGSGSVNLSSPDNELTSFWRATSIDIGTGGSGTLEVGSRAFVQTGAMRVGQGGGIAVLDVRDGGLVISGASVVGGHAATVSVANETSPRLLSQWLLSGDLDVGDVGSVTPGSALIRILAGGALDASGRIRVHSGGSVLLDGGALKTAGLDLEAGGSFDWRKGQVDAGAVTLGSSAWTPALMVLSPGQTLQSTAVDVNSGLLVVNGGVLLTSRLSLGGGMVVNSAGFDDVSFGTSRFDALEGAGTLSASLRSLRPTAKIVASGGVLTVGDANRTGAFEFTGSTRVAAGSRLLILSADRGTLGQTTTLEAGSALQSLKGLFLAPGRVLEAEGNAEVIGDFTNQGTVRGPTAAGQVLTFNDDVNGAGAFTGNVLFEQMHSPGNSPAIQSFENVTYASTATLVIEILGAAPGTGHDRVDVSALATLGGTLDVRFLDGYAPSAGQSFVVLTWGTRAGSFAALDVSGLDPSLRLTATYGEHALTLSTAPVPEPGEWALLLAGLGAMGWRLRGRVRRA